MSSADSHPRPEEPQSSKTPENPFWTTDLRTAKERHIDRMLESTLERDEKREQAFDALAHGLLSMQMSGKFASEFVRCANELWEPHTQMNPSEYPSIRLVEKPAELKELELRYNTTFNRPVVIMDHGDYQRFYKHMFNRGGSWGFNMNLSTGANLIVGTPSSDTIHHELRHSIDAHQFKRKGDDAVLDEFVAFYGDVINPRILAVTTTTTDEQGNKVTTKSQNILHMKVGEMGKKLKSDTHHQQCCPHRTFEEYCAIVDRVTGMLDRLSKKYSPVEIDRILYHSKTIADIEGML